MKVIYENSRYIVEEHPLAPKPYWIISKAEVNPLHAVECFYDTERAIEWADDYEMQDLKEMTRRAVLTLKSLGQDVSDLEAEFFEAYHEKVGEETV